MLEAGTWMYQWSGQLGSMAEDLVQKVPDDEEWNVIRHFLRNMSAMFRKGDFKAGARAFYKVIPYVQRALASTEKATNINKTFDLTASISEHFLVEDEAREQINKFMIKVKENIGKLRTKVESFATSLDLLLEQVLEDGKNITVFECLKLAFQMNRISAHIRTCESQLEIARSMIDDLDTHVAGKTFLAVLLSYIAFIFGIVFSSTGQIPLGAACITAATASRQSAQGLYAYRKELIKLDAEHKTFQSEIIEWKSRFRSEQINFLLLFGIKRIAIFTLSVVITLMLVGKTANFLVFSVIFMYFVVRSEETNSKRYTAAMTVGLLAVLMEFQNQNGLIAFNSIFTGGLCLCYMGFIDF